MHLGHDGHYGFIAGDDARDYYFNERAALNFEDLKIGDAVEFMSVDIGNDKGPIARAVRKPEPKAVQYGAIIKG